MLLNGVYVVTSQVEGRKSGLAVAWATQVEKHHILISLGAGSFTCREILATRVFALSQLHEAQTELAKTFGLRSSADMDKFAGVATEVWGTGAPLLVDRYQGFECEVIESSELVDQVLFTARILRSEPPRADVEPLPYITADYYDGSD